MKSIILLVAVITMFEMTDAIGEEGMLSICNVLWDNSLFIAKGMHWHAQN